MKFFLDHDVPAEVGRVLRQEGHKVTEPRQVLCVQADDGEAFNYAREHGLFLITCSELQSQARQTSGPGVRP